jgi:hypothetical protein
MRVNNNDYDSSYKKIIKAIENTEFKNLTELKEKVDKSFTFMELRMVLFSRDV